MHLRFSQNDEASARESFFDGVTICNLKNSLQKTLDTLPEPLIITQREKVVYSNEAFTKVIKEEQGERDVSAVPINSEVLKRKKVSLTREEVKDEAAHYVSEPEEAVQSSLGEFFMT